MLMLLFVFCGLSDSKRAVHRAVVWRDSRCRSWVPGRWCTGPRLPGGASTVLQHIQGTPTSAEIICMPLTRKMWLTNMALSFVIRLVLYCKPLWSCELWLSVQLVAYLFFMVWVGSYFSSTSLLLLFPSLYFLVNK